MDDKISKRLREIFKDDHEAIEKFAVKAVDNELDKIHSEQLSSKKNSDGLNEYLQSGKTGSRDYGIKGQGW